MKDEKNRRLSRALSVVRVIAGIYFGAALLMAGCQRSYLYFPRRGPEAGLQTEAMQAGLRPWHDAGGARIGWLGGSANPAAVRVLVFHGNAGCAVDRGYFAEAFAAGPGGRDWRIHLFEYPGYGSRAGSPSESTFRAAAREALDALLAERPDPVLVLGESLGSGVACRLAADQPDGVRGLLLITPFTSMTAVAAAHYPGLPVRLLLRDRFDAAGALRGYRGPVAIVVAGRDEVVPARFGRALYEGYAGPKKLFEQPDRTHNTLDLEPAAPWWEESVAFLLRGGPPETEPAAVAP